nr:MAG TPA: hypothetical protein [Caudoviricetes sp.]
MSLRLSKIKDSLYCNIGVVHKIGRVCTNLLYQIAIILQSRT